MTLEGRSLAFSYGRKPVVNGVDLSVRPGEITGLVGPNGAGKSTLVKLLSGVERPGRGEVELDGVPLRQVGRKQVARRIAVAQQSGELPDGFRVREIVSMGRSPYLRLLSGEGERDRTIVRQAMRETGILPLEDRFVWELSGGERQRVVLARALAQEPAYLLLDEPTTHLDLRFQVEILRQIREQAKAGLGVLVVLHDLNLAARGCDQVVVLSQGSVEARGRPSEVLTAELLQRVYGTEVELIVDEDGSLSALLPSF